MKRSFQIIAVLACLAGILSVAFLQAEDTAAPMAAELLAAEGSVTPLLSEKFKVAPDNIGLAYKVQKAYVEQKLKNDSTAGYKGALTAEPLMKKFGAKAPASSVLFTSGHLTSSPVIDTAGKKGVMLETEIGYITSKAISKKLNNVEELKACISKIFPAVEVPIVGFESLGKVTPFDLIAANTGSWKFITGPEQPMSDELAKILNHISVVMTLDGVPYNEGSGSDTLGDQWNALLWIVNDVTSRGEVIKEGSILISGAMGKMLPAKPGKYEANFGQFGKIEFEIK